MLSDPQIAHNPFPSRKGLPLAAAGGFSDHRSVKLNAVRLIRRYFSRTDKKIKHCLLMAVPCRKNSMNIPWILYG